MNNKAIENDKILEITENLESMMRTAFKERESEPVSSFNLVKSVYNQAKKAGIVPLELKALHGLCSMSHYFKPEDDHSNWIDILLARGIDLDNNLAIGRAYIHHYRAARQKEQYSEASKFLMTALKYFDPQLHTSDVSSCYTGLGNLHVHLEDYDKALEFYHKALELIKDQPMNRSFNLLQNIAGVYIIKKDYAKAWESYHNLLPVVPETEVIIRVKILQNLGHLCHETEQIEDAVTYFQEALEIKLNSGIEHEIIRSFCNLINSQIHLEQAEEAYKSIKEAEKHLKPDRLAELIEFLQIYIKYSKLIDDKQMQIELYEKLIAAKDEKTKLAEIDQMDKYEFQHQIDVFKQDISVQKSKNVILTKKVKFLIDSLQETLKQQDTSISNTEKVQLEPFEKDLLLEKHHHLSSISEMLSIIEKQWKQPLAVIKKLVYEIKDDYYFNELSWNSISQKSTLINELISFLSDNITSFNELFKVQEVKMFWASAVIKSTLKLLSNKIANSNITLNTNLINDFIIHGELNKMIQVIVFIIFNTIEAQKASKQTSPQINITLEYSDRYNYITIENNGGNIFKNTENNLIYPFTKAMDSEGTDLEFSNCKHIIESIFQGEIFYEDTAEGTKYRISFPPKKR